MHKPSCLHKSIIIYMCICIYKLHIFVYICTNHNVLCV